MSKKGHNRDSLVIPISWNAIASSAFEAGSGWPLGPSAALLNPRVPWALLNLMLWASRIEYTNGLRGGRCSRTASPHTSSIVSSDITSDSDKSVRFQE